MPRCAKTARCGASGDLCVGARIDLDRGLARSLGSARVGPQSHCVTDREGQFGAIQRVEVKFVDAVLAQLLHLLDCNMRCDQAARTRIVIESVEALSQPKRYLGP